MTYRMREKVATRPQNWDRLGSSSARAVADVLPVCLEPVMKHGGKRLLHPPDDWPDLSRNSDGADLQACTTWSRALPRHPTCSRDTPPSVPPRCHPTAERWLLSSTARQLSCETRQVSQFGSFGWTRLTREPCSRQAEASCFNASELFTTHVRSNDKGGSYLSLIIGSRPSAGRFL